jgi:hypothetical protein
VPTDSLAAAIAPEGVPLPANPVAHPHDRPDAPAVEALLLTPRAAAAALSVSERTLWAMTSPRGPIPAVRLGRAVRYSVAALREFIRVAQEGGGA